MAQTIPKQDVAFENDHLQFGLVLKRIYDLNLLSPGKMNKLATSLDYTEDELYDVIGRATHAVDDYMTSYFGDNPESDD